MQLGRALSSRGGALSSGGVEQRGGVEQLKHQVAEMLMLSGCTCGVGKVRQTYLHLPHTMYDLLYYGLPRH